MLDNVIIPKKDGKKIDIKPYDKNAKKHPDRQLKQIAESLRRFGWQQPIKVGSNGVIIAGHGRWFAYKKYPDGIRDPWIINETGETISGCAETRVLSEEEEMAYRLADNKLNESEWDMELVRVDMKILGDSPLLGLTGFSPDLIIESDDRDDDAPPIPDEPKSKIGDIYQLGPHRVMCGDSTKAEDVEKLMNGQKADMVFTDPPYNVNYSGRGEKTSNTILNDKMGDDKFTDFLVEVFKRYEENCKKGAGWYIFHSPSTQDQFTYAIEKTDWKIKNQIIWNKPVVSMGWGDYRWKHEPLFYCGNEKTQFYGDRKNTTILEMPEEPEKAIKWLQKQRELEKKGYTTVWSTKRESLKEYVHPTQKPVELITYAVLNSSKSDDIVLDLFLGSGATIISAHKTGRICYGIELDPKYVDVIVQRWEEYTGEQAIKCT